MEKFGIHTFNKKMMKETLSESVYTKWKEAVRLKEDLDIETAEAIAHDMKNWAIKKGATHYSHWFQPLNGQTAKKQEAFLDRNINQEPIYKFSGKELLKSEPDASSFPSGGMRSTFEARGYTYWDPSANSFIIDKVLYIPSIFVSYNGEILDKRFPLLKSVNILSQEGSRLVNLFEKNKYCYRMRVKVGLEQEFFLIDKNLYEKRSDLKTSGRTIIGAKAPKMQEQDDHYFGVIPKRVQKFFEEVNEKLWALGIYGKTEHNEAAPCQFELASLFENVHIAVDDNLLIMNILKQTALENGMVCLLHEKPFEGVNGSGKHNNYSITTNYGLNCFDPGKNPRENYIFLLFVSALIEATDNYSALLRICSSSPSNDYRLGGNEAPPAILSIFLGKDLEELFNSIAYKTPLKEKKDKMKVYALGEVQVDASDRNRTSPIAFTGNKFEFRMLGSSKTPADINIILNCAIGLSLRKMADKLEKVEEKDLKEEALKIVSQIIHDHGRLVYGGDNYGDSWKEEAKKRGLKDYKRLFDALVGAKEDGCQRIFLESGILSEKEIKAIYEVQFEDLVKYHSLEARTMINMVKKDVMPAVLAEIKDTKEALSGLDNPYLKKRLDKLNELLLRLFSEMEILTSDYKHSETIKDIFKRAKFLEENIVKSLRRVREICDNLEEEVSRKNWTLPSYEDMFNSLN